MSLEQTRSAADERETNGLPRVLVSTTVNCRPVRSQLVGWECVVVVVVAEEEEEGGNEGDATAPCPYVVRAGICLFGVEDLETRTRALGPPMANRSFWVRSRFFHSSAMTVAGFKISKFVR